MLQQLKNKIASRAYQLHTLLSIDGALRARLNGCYFEIYGLLDVIKCMNIVPSTVLDVGANRGMFSKTANYLFPKAKIIAFEPLKSCFDELFTLKKVIPQLECHNVALSDSDSEEDIFHCSYDYSSSLLEMEELHKVAFPISDGYSKEKVKLRKLDSIIELGNYERPILLKMDVQGYEGHVIHGAKNSIGKVDMILVEMSFHRLYKNQILFDELYKLITNNGFEFMGPIAISKHPITRLTLQIDGLFKRIQS